MTKIRKSHLLLLLLTLVLVGLVSFISQTAEAPTINNHSKPTSSNMSLSLTSTAFADGEMIPDTYTCDGENVNPPLTISGVPEGTKTLVLVMDDPDIPQEVKTARGIEKYDHWVVYGLPAELTEIPIATKIGTAGSNSSGATVYTGPCPPPQYEPTTHRYIFRLYALSGQLNFLKTPTLDEVETAAQSQALDSATLTGLYTRAE